MSSGTTTFRNAHRHSVRHASNGADVKNQIYSAPHKEHCNTDDELANIEIERCRYERAMRNGNGSHDQRVICDCAEGIINGRRVAVHRPCDCAYVRERTKLCKGVEMAVTIRLGDPAGDKERGYEWTKAFVALMEEFAEPLLQSGNGVASTESPTLRL